MNPFVSPPFWRCAKCTELYFGVLSIGEFGYYRRCAKCGYPKSSEKSMFFPLPTVNKTIIYLDQCILSGMVKSLHPDRKKKIDPFYLEAFKKLDRLSKLQLIICPDSQYHESESIFSSYPTEHKRVYELLSHAVSFEDSWSILRFEMSEQLNKWLKGQPMGETDIVPQRVVSGKINSWQERILISIYSKRIENAKQEIWDTKEDAFKILQGLFEKWESNKGRTFDYWYNEEIGQWPSLVINTYKDHIRRLVAAMSGDYDPLSLIPTPLCRMYSEISESLKAHASGKDEFEKKLNLFMTADCFKAVPFIRIFSMVMATFGARISNGNMKKENIESSMFDDTMMVSTVLPFCDAIFLEKQMAGFLRDNPLKGVLTKMPKVFSLSNKSEFLVYLDKLEETASAEHLAAVKEVYGENWPAPFTTILKEYKSKI